MRYSIHTLPVDLRCLPRPMAAEERTRSPHAAWTWLALLCVALAIPAKADIPPGERAVLLALYSATGGANWTNNAGWNGPPGTECINWAAIECDAGKNHVTKIYMGGNNLTGSLPALVGLTQLEHLGVYDNPLTGNIPALSGMSELVVVDLHNNHLTGSIPALQGLTKLVTFSAFSNQLTGSVPSLASLASLRILSLYRNQLSGDMPDVPHPSVLWDNHSSLCLPNGMSNDSNGFSQLPNAGWNTATGFTPWYVYCGNAPDPISSNGFD